ncbi:TetR/AcrR family transcriptional regulator [candidate division KSB1 bacterium]|nr:TetR/AcrR family transcriptional regulator [candidate division KSB1 bacterium]
MPNNFDSRKEQIIHAALKIISEEGVANLTMMKIAQKIGISDAALYRHFKNKHEIMRGVIETMGRNLTANMSVAVSDIDDPIAKLKKILGIHLAYLEKNRGIPRLIFSEAVHQNDPVLRKTLLQMVNSYLDLIRGILRRAKAEGRVKEDINIEAGAIGFLGLVQATALLWSLSDFSFSISKKAPALWRVFAESLS